jgi:hypothetical protein
MDNLSPAPKKMENPMTQPINQDVLNLLKNKGKANQNPVVEKAKNQLLQVIKQYKLDPKQLIESGKLASTALKNKEMYPIAVQHAIRQGLISPQDVAPQGIDYKLLANGITAGKLTQQLIDEGKL